jgi:hypothetical protein
MNYDNWLATNPHDNDLGRSDGRPSRFRCSQCAWKGNGSMNRFDHYARTGHAVLYADDPRFDDSRAAKESA